MANPLLDTILSEDPSVRDRDLAGLLAGAGTGQVLAWAHELEAFRHRSENLYTTVRTLFFLHAIHRFHLPPLLSGQAGRIPHAAHVHLLQRRFGEAIEVLLESLQRDGLNDALCSALASAYHRLAIQTLANQVRRSVRSVRGNQWMFRIGHPADQPLRILPALLARDPATGLRPVLRETTPVRMDLTHSAWSDIFFLGMDFPEGARVLNISVDLGVHGRDPAPRPPIECFLRIIDEPVLRLTSLDLGASADISELAEVFDFARDHLGLLKAAVIAAGLVPPGMEGSGQRLSDLLARMAGPGHGLELCSQVNDIPKGSRLAVSTNLLASLIALAMRATGQTAAPTGPLSDGERRTVAARAILGEWLGGSGGGWQDSGGIWPGIKLIEGVAAAPGDPEYGISRGRLLPQHTVLGPDVISPATRVKLQESLIVVHGGMAQNVGPILEMVTEKYLLRSASEWEGRRQALAFLDRMLGHLRSGDIRALGQCTTANFRGPLQAIIPWATNAYTETLIAGAEEAFGTDFWGFWMLGGMSGGGMGFLVAPHRRAGAPAILARLMARAKKQFQHGLPFAMDPLIYDFSINEDGTHASWLHGSDALFPGKYYSLLLPSLIRREARDLPASRRSELGVVASVCRTRPGFDRLVDTLFEQLLPRPASTGPADSLPALLERNGFDREQHELIRGDLKAGRIGLAQNRLPASTFIADAAPEDWIDARTEATPEEMEAGRHALLTGMVGVFTLAAGVGSRWTQGAGVVKALHPFARLDGHHRTFLDVHLAKSRHTARTHGTPPVHLVATSYLTHDPIASWIDAHSQTDLPLLASPGRSIGLRLIPTVRDLHFAWEEMPQQMLDEQAQKVRESSRQALIEWARSTGEASDYTDNLPSQCLHPVGHWYEFPNLLLNGVLARVLETRPQLRYLLLHNIDTLGASLDPGLLGRHILSQAALSFEIIPRRLEDRGGGLARIDGRPRLVEGLALPREEDEFKLSFYNSMTTWIDLDPTLAAFGLSRSTLSDPVLVAEAVRRMARRMPTYVTLKDVKKRWGNAQEDIFPVTQFEKLWSDMSLLPDLDCRYFLVPRLRGQQLKEQSQLDGWVRDGSAAALSSCCLW
jgi:hypothetical protein